MGSVTASLAETAESIFSDLGYSVSRCGDELRAERKWRSVQVTPMTEPGETPDSGDLRCFVVPSECANDLREKLLGRRPDYDWAIIGVESEDDYEVLHPVVESPVSARP